MAIGNSSIEEARGLLAEMRKVLENNDNCSFKLRTGLETDKDYLEYVNDTPNGRSVNEDLYKLLTTVTKLNSLSSDMIGSVEEFLNKQSEINNRNGGV